MSGRSARVAAPSGQPPSVWKKVRDVMTSLPVTVSPETSVADLKQLFERHDYNAFPVAEADGTLRGIVTKLDILRSFRPDPLRETPELRAPRAERVADIMRRGIITLEPDDPVVAAVDLMLESRLRSLPVVERRRGQGPVLVGFVSRGDLLRGFEIEGGAAE